MSYKSEKTKCEQCGNTKSIEVGRKLCSYCRKMNAFVKTGRIKEPDFSDYHIDGYKEPLTKVDEGYGYIGCIATSNDDDTIQCHMCGYFFEALGSHISNYHQMNIKEYKLKYGLRIKEGLISPNLRSVQQDNYNKTVRSKAKEYLKKAHKKNEQLRKDGKLKTGGNMWTAQSRNERGNCKAQTIAKIQYLADVQEGVVSMQDFLREFGWGQHETIKHWFGTWKIACKEAGVTTWEQDRKKRTEKMKADILINVREFYDKNGRVPQSADFDSNPQFPGHTWITKRYGSLNNLRELAGVPKLVQVGREWAEEVN